MHYLCNKYVLVQRLCTYVQYVIELRVLHMCVQWDLRQTTPQQLYTLLPVYQLTLLFYTHCTSQ